jgi:hypothetical protein
MSDNQDKVTSRMNAFAAIIVAITGLVGLFLGGPKIKEMIYEGQELTEEAPKEEPITNSDLIVDKINTSSEEKEIFKEDQEPTEEALKEETKIDSVDFVNEVDTSSIKKETQKNIKFEVIRNGFQLKETRYITFDNEKYRLSFRDINSVRKTAVAVIRNKKEEEITRDTIAKGKIFRFEINSIFYEVHLYGIKDRSLSSNLAYFDIYKEK